MHAQSLQPSQVAEAGWDGAAELVGVEEAESTSGTPQHYAALTSISSAGHAQLSQPREAAQAGGDGATELVGIEEAESARLSAVQEQPATRRTHMYCNPVMLPMLAGMVPLSWLPKR